MSDLSTRSCRPGSPALSPEEARRLVAEVPGWTVDGDSLRRTFRFTDYWRTMAFVNALAWIAHNEDHHPDLGVHYNRCEVTFSTHDAGGITENDFICAAKVSALV